MKRKTLTPKPFTGIGRCARTTYHEAVTWFKGLGYAVEPGPRIEEVTLINDQRQDFLTHYVVPVGQLAGMADLS